MKTIFQIGTRALFTARATQYLCTPYIHRTYAYYSYTYIYFFTTILKPCCYCSTLGINWRHCAINDADFLHDKAGPETEVRTNCNGYSPGESRDTHKHTNGEIRLRGKEGESKKKSVSQTRPRELYIYKVYICAPIYIY